jgi:hypothetical protein
MCRRVHLSSVDLPEPWTRVTSRICNSFTTGGIAFATDARVFGSGVSV